MIPRRKIGRLTEAQRRALGGLEYATSANRTAKELFVRSDVLWRLEEAGLVARNAGDVWWITPAGRAAYEASRLGAGEKTPRCPHDGHALRWVEDQWYCSECGDEWPENVGEA